MSQAKVDKYKEAKKNRKKQMKKEKIQSYLRRGVACIVAAALIGMAGFSIYNIYESKQPKQEVTVDYSAIASLCQITERRPNREEERKMRVNRKNPVHYFFALKFS